MINLFPPGILGIDVPRCDCDQCIRGVEATSPSTRTSASRVPGLVVDHFGERMRTGKYGHRLTRSTYALPNKTPSSYDNRSNYSPRQWETDGWVYEDEDHTRYSDAFCAQQRDEALINFDLNMEFFSQIPPADFEAALTKMLQKNKQLRPVSDLKDWTGDGGLYVMVFDEYRQVYVGQSGNIRARIKKHWSGTKAFDRLLCGSPEESVLSIDSFRCLDTTRIFAARTTRVDVLERRILSTLPKEYVLNRVNGGRPDGLRLMLLGLETNRRRLLPECLPSIET
ncbi:GIY-YIG nuclease family protein [Cryobacterium sp. PH31-L1]|uniref:GIY-YIG nuclease family protein n=1 Tax=Cryobacterium sp. PH31-L1 TaxID=3046199 RepID=UPI0024BB3216|nr:GIY-YIG nuclease family protein [Cryobacterium sp. PH31-L1]MDJ0379204.1 GIY-YIG nuclease family protein [Cryobacterium sp. PH31-L1]